MKKCFVILSAVAGVALLAVSCAKNLSQEGVAQNEESVITAMTSSGSATKVSATEAQDGKRAVVWDKGDSISVFNCNSFNQLYSLVGEGGTTKGKFRHAGGFGFGTEFFRVVASYPYNPSNEFMLGTLKLNIPTDQVYRKDNFDPKANVMVGEAEPGDPIPFKNVGAYLVLKLYGDNMKVGSIIVRGRNKELLSGPVGVQIVPGEDPVLVDIDDDDDDLDRPRTRGLVEKRPMLWKEYDIVRLHCRDSVLVGKTEADATSFWMVVRPQDMENGFDVQVNFNGDNYMVQSVTGKTTFGRSTVLGMAPLKTVATPDVERIDWIKAVVVWDDDDDDWHFLK